MEKIFFLLVNSGIYYTLPCPNVSKCNKFTELENLKKFNYKHNAVFYFIFYPSVPQIIHDFKLTRLLIC